MYTGRRVGLLCRQDRRKKDILGVGSGASPLCIGMVVYRTCVPRFPPELTGSVSEEEKCIRSVLGFSCKPHLQEGLRNRDEAQHRSSPQLGARRGRVLW